MSRMSRRNGSNDQRGERWVAVSSNWTAQPPPAWIPRANPGARRNPAVGAVASYLQWLASYNNMPVGSFLPGGTHHREFMAEGMESPKIQAAAEPPPTRRIEMTEAEGQKSAKKIAKAAAAVVEVQQQNTADSVEAIERNIEELKTKVFKTGKGDWSRATAGRGRPPTAYADAMKNLETQLEAARRLQGVVQTSAAVVEGAEKVTKTRKQKPTDAAPVVMAAAQDATAAAEQAQAISENVADTVAQIAQDAGVQVDIVDSAPAPLPPVALAVEDEDAELMAALMEQSAVPAPAAEPEMSEAERKRASRMAKAARLIGNPRKRQGRSNGARRNPVLLTPKVAEAIKNKVRKAGGSASEVEEVYEMLSDVAAAANPKPGQSTEDFYRSFIASINANIQGFLAIVREDGEGSPEVAEEVIATTPPAPSIPEVPAPAPSPVVAPVVAPISRKPAVSGENMSDAQLEAEIKKLINEVIDEMLGESVKSNPRRRH